MKWKIFMMACVSSFIISFPQNMIGCGPGIDPYDYYTTFFNPAAAENNLLRPFYYTGYNFLYEEEDAVSTADVLAGEWAEYCGTSVSAKDAKAFVMQYAQKDISNLYYNIEKNQPLKIPDSVRRNSMTNYFIQKKDPEALGYLIYAKKTEPLVTGGSGSWDAVVRDSLSMAKLIKNGQQLYNAAKTDLFRLKFAYQVTRLAHYSGNYNDAIKFYDEMIAPNKTVSVLQPLSLALKAGALYRSGQTKKSAYIFSKVFNNTDVKKISNYMSFRWAVDSKADRKEYLSLCSGNEEKADMLALFALGSTEDETLTLKQIFSLSPNNNALETITGREINKLEEKYFTPAMNREKGGSLFYYTWAGDVPDSTLNSGAAAAHRLTDQLIKMEKPGNKNPGFYTTAAAYVALMTKDFGKANEYLASAKKLNLSKKVNDQWMLTNLLLSINEVRNFDAAAEEKILPSVQWLRQKAMEDKPVAHGFESSTATWKIFYRNIMAGALAKKYHAQGDIYKETLAIGSADKLYGSTFSVDFLHDNTDVKDVELLHSLMTNKTVSKFENYLLKNNQLTTADIIDFAGTAYLRNYDYVNAAKWLQKSAGANKYSVMKDPFIDLLYDREERFSYEKKGTTKLSFTQEMIRLQKAAETDKLNAAKQYYKMALGLYNITYYGHTWELVQYSRSGSDGYFIPKDATAFQKEYYGCFAAHDMFKKAMEASGDKNFKARCLFMMAKCAQKSVGRPTWDQFGYNYEQYDAAEKEFFPLFKNNKYFPQFVKEYGNTAFYKEALGRCSYLRDFIKKK